MLTLPTYLVLGGNARFITTKAPLEHWGHQHRGGDWCSRTLPPKICERCPKPPMSGAGPRVRSGRSARLSLNCPCRVLGCRPALEVGVGWVVEDDRSGTGRTDPSLGRRVGRRTNTHMVLKVLGTAEGRGPRRSSPAASCGTFRLQSPKIAPQQPYSLTDGRQAATRRHAGTSRSMGPASSCRCSPCRIEVDGSATCGRRSSRQNGLGTSRGMRQPSP